MPAVDVCDSPQLVRARMSMSAGGAQSAQALFDKMTQQDSVGFLLNFDHYFAYVIAISCANLSLFEIMIILGEYHAGNDQR